jgi:hypothetical protein
MKEKFALTGVTPSSEYFRRIYLAGPMTGYPEHNFPAFNRAAAVLEGRGFHVENPATHGVHPWAGHSDYLRYDVTRLVTCAEIVVLPGWESSKGAQIEVTLARGLGMPVLEFEQLVKGEDNEHL